MLSSYLIEPTRQYSAYRQCPLDKETCCTDDCALTMFRVSSRETADKEIDTVISKCAIAVIAEQICGMEYQAEESRTAVYEFEKEDDE